MYETIIYTASRDLCRDVAKRKTRGYNPTVPIPDNKISTSTSESNHSPTPLLRSIEYTLIGRIF